MIHKILLITTGFANHAGIMTALDPKNISPYFLTITSFRSWIKIWSRMTLLVLRHKKYTVRLKATQQKTKLKDAVRTAYGKLDGHEVRNSCYGLFFYWWIMGSVVGEKIARAIDYAIQKQTPFYHWFQSQVGLA
jgi:acetyl-CoA carboxylase beta subunit